MPQTESELTPLESRKQLLLAESEANRMQLSDEWHSLHEAMSGLAHQARSGLALASGASLLLGGWAAFLRLRRARRPIRSSWISSLINGARVAASLWLAQRSRSR
jgi:hypothetical protein